MSSALVVTFIYELPEKFHPQDDFRSILEKFGWHFKIDERPLPKGSCVQAFDSSKLNEQTALDFCGAQILEVIKLIREHSGFKDFTITRYYFISHKAPPAKILFGTDLSIGQ